MTIIPQIVILVLYFIGLLMSANRHGKEKTGKHNFWLDIITAGIVLSLYYWAGTFDPLFK